jgi:hypothetical protein
MPRADNNNNNNNKPADKERNDQLQKQHRCNKKTTAATANGDKSNAETERYETKRYN